MNYIINEEQLDRIIKPYFDKRFKDSEYDTRKSGFEDLWTGYWVTKDGFSRLLIGHPANDDGGIWFSNGEILDGWTYFDIKPEQFYDSLKRYLEKTYEIKIGDVM
jgi:hypothetical protein